MKKIFLILFVLPFILFGQEQSPCYSVNDYNISILEQNPPLTIDLSEGWNMIGYPCFESMQVEDAMLPIVGSKLKRTHDMKENKHIQTFDCYKQNLYS